MDRALYEPEQGYYARPGRRVGREGDFFTSVSVGPLFGKLLARHLARWRDGRGGPWRILELGAHDGSLARDVLDALSSDFPEAFAELEYVIIEPLPTLESRQRESLAPFQDRLRIVRRPDEIEPRQGVLVANELIDALPCRVVESSGDGWQEMGVGLDEAGEFRWCSVGDAAEIAGHLPRRPAGYRTEVRPNLEAFLAPLVPLISGGTMLWIDYGFEAEDYYAEGRSEGTLQCYRQHRKGSDPLVDPGEVDITAHVDFTSLKSVIEALGGKVTRFENQARFLTEVGRDFLLSLEGRTDDETMRFVRQFQTLTHPAQLGSRFHLMEASFDPAAT